MVDWGLIVDMALLDFSKAYDAISYVVLVEKLWFLGAAKVRLLWMLGFLVGRTLQVINRVCSGSRDVLSDKPKGSVLGPAIYITDGLDSNFGAFAYEYKIYMHYSRQEVFGEVA